MADARTDDDSVDIEMLSSLAPAPDDSVAEAERFAAFEAALYALPTRQREAIQMSRGIGGGTPKTEREIGKLWGVSRSTVHYFITQGIATIREAIGAKT